MIELLAQSNPNSSQVKYHTCMHEVQERSRSCVWAAGQVAKPDEPKYKANLDHCMQQVRQYQETRCDPLLFKDK
jgi:hypothetical protein